MVLVWVVCACYTIQQPNPTSIKEELQHNTKGCNDCRKRGFWFFLFYVLYCNGFSRGACGRCLFLFCVAKRIFFIFCMFFVLFCFVFFCFFLFFLFFLVFFGVFLWLFLIFVLPVLDWCFWCFLVFFWYFF